MQDRMKKTYLLILLLTIPSVLASLQIEPQSQSITAKVNYEKIIPITVRNAFNFSIYDINFTHIENVNFPYIAQLLPNESIQKNITIKTLEPFTQTRYSTVTFKYYTSIFDDPKHYNITVTDSQFIPNLQIIEQGDYITWLNKGTITHTATDTAGSFDKSIAVNGSDQVRLQSIGDIDYYDQSILFHGYLRVLNKSQELTYNQDYNKQLTFIITSEYNETTLQISTEDNNFTLAYNAQTEGILKLENIGSYKIINVTLQAEKWISFDENHFDIDSSSTNYVMFTLDPSITEATQTNRTYTIDITAKGINSQQVKQQITLFIPYESQLLDLQNLTREQLYEKLSELEETLKNLNVRFEPECPVTKPFYNIAEKKCVSREEVSQYMVTYNYTQEEIKQFLIKLQTLQDNDKTFTDWAKPKIDSLESAMNNLLPMLQNSIRLGNQSLELSKKNEERIDSGRTWTIFIIAIFCIILASLATFYIIREKRKQKAIV